MISRKGMEDMNDPLDRLHERVIVSLRGTQSLSLLLEDIDNRLDRLAGYELVEDLMLDQVSPCSLLEFIQSSFKEGSQLGRGVERHGDEGTCLVVENQWKEN
jgi:hypothetical protein